MNAKALSRGLLERWYDERKEMQKELKMPKTMMAMLNIGTKDS